jgi:methylamine---glutamate N-methyltransferase subunit A
VSVRDAGHLLVNVWSLIVRSLIEIFRYVVTGRSCRFHPAFRASRIRFCPGKGSKKAMVHVDDLPRMTPCEQGREDLHMAHQSDRIDIAAFPPVNLTFLDFHPVQGRRGGVVKRDFVNDWSHERKRRAAMAAPIAGQSGQSGNRTIASKKLLSPRVILVVYYKYYVESMCGIVGYFDKTDADHQPLGRVLLRMLHALACRGPDSAGVALFGVPQPNQFVARVKVGDHTGSAPRIFEVKAIGEKFGAREFVQQGDYLRFTLHDDIDLPSFISGVESVAADVEVVSVGRNLEIIKQVGSPSRLEQSFGISGFQGGHGIGHTRLSTESVVDLSHSQPFWGHGYPDLAIVHNGHITNYHQLRRRYQQRGIRFYTENDSEVVAIFLADRLKRGITLRAALESMITDLDGSFSCLVATDSALAFVKDSFSFKPLLYTETESFAAVATEEIAMRAAIPGDYVVREGRAKEVQIWQR